MRMLAVRVICIQVGLGFGLPGVAGGVELPTMLGNHAVLQRGEPVPVWGWGKPGEEVTVSFAGQVKRARVNEKGSWRLELDAMEASAKGRPMEVTGADGQSVKVEDVLVGEVWMASGQSNMQWALSATERAKEDIPTANDPAVRMFLTDLVTAGSPQRRVGGEWNVTTPQNAGKFSAVGYYFALRLREELGVPVGIIRTAWGGKPSEAFTSRESLAMEPEGTALLQKLDSEMRRFDLARAQVNYEKKVEAWQKAWQANKAEKDPKKRKKLPRKPQKPKPPALSPNRPMSIYNGMIHPWVGYAMKGAIWYQGESNAGRAKEYETIFPLLILDWRRQWKKELPFYFVQLANFRAPSRKPGEASSWAELQNAQRLALRLPATGMAVINDIGDARDIHPRNKKDVGERLALWALANDYNKKGVVVSGPLYREFQVEDGRLRILFEHAGGLRTRDGKAPGRFEIAGQDQVWHWAEAVIEGEAVVVSSPKVIKPVAVRYAWASNPEGANLVNGAGLPASLFRTDTWKLSTER